MKMSNIKVGDRVICIRNGISVKLHREYTVLSKEKEHGISYIILDGLHGWFFEDRFCLAPNLENE